MNCPLTDAASVAKKAAAARAAQPAWAATPMAERLGRGAALSCRDRRRARDLATTLTRKFGKPIRQSRMN